MVRRFLLCAALFAAAACSGIPDLDLVNMVLPLGVDVNTRVAESLAWDEANAPVNINVAPVGYRFAVCSDVHANPGEKPQRFSAFMNGDYGEFYLMLGDLVGKTGGMDVAYSEMAGTTGFVVVGNHDLFFHNWEAWRQYFNTSTYYFTVTSTASKDLFIMLDSASGTLGEKQTDWLRGVFRDIRPGCDRCFVATHTNILKTDNSQTPSSNFPLEETWLLLDLFARNGVSVVFTGHDHCRDVSVFNGVTYVTLDDIKDSTPNASYLMVSVPANPADACSLTFKEF